MCGPHVVTKLTLFPFKDIITSSHTLPNIERALVASFGALLMGDPVA